MKLSKTQQEVLDKIIDDIRFAKKFNNVRDYWIALQCKGCEGSSKYEEIKEHYSKLYHDGVGQTWKEYWLDNLNNITLTICNSATLRALEKASYIEIIEDGGRLTDRVRLLKETN